jgi:hypothetical protein
VTVIRSEVEIGDNSCIWINKRVDIPTVYWDKEMAGLVNYDYTTNGNWTFILAGIVLISSLVEPVWMVIRIGSEEMAT